MLERESQGERSSRKDKLRKIRYLASSSLQAPSELRKHVVSKHVVSKHILSGAWRVEQARLSGHAMPTLMLVAITAKYNLASKGSVYISILI